MKTKLIAVMICVVLSGCATTKRGENEIEPIMNQRLSTSFKQDTIKIETRCGWFTTDKSKCEVIAIEATASVPTNGNSENNLRTGLIRANMLARANVRHFMHEDVSSSRVVNTIAKNVEKANDRMKSRTQIGEAVAMSDNEAERETNFSVRENSNDTAHQVTETIRTNAQGILRGFKTVRQEVTGNQTVSVTIRWDVESDHAANTLLRKFSR